MSELSPEARQLLDATRSAGGPSAAQRLAMKKAVLSSVAAPAAVVAVKAGLGLKLGVAAVALGMAAAAYVALAPAPTELPAPSPAPAPVVEAPAVEPVAPGVVEAPPEPAPAPVVAAVKPPAPKPVAVVAVPEPIAEPAVPPLPPPAPAVVDEATLSREVSAIEEANETVREGRFDDALAQLGHYADEFPSGALATEAGVVKVIALCGLNRVDEARAIGAKLPTNNPAVRRLERSCIK